MRGGMAITAALVVVAAAAESRWAELGREITYDGRALVVSGARRMFFSGDMHYARSTPEMWPKLIAKAKNGGLDVIQTYVFWNVHEPIQGQYNFEGRYDLVKFIREIQAQGLYVSLRIGPFVEAEWKYGGFPFWLHDVPSITFRSDNEPFKQHMQNFVTKIVTMMKHEGLYYPQGGPIIISQIENEYQMIEPAFGASGPRYVRWAAAMAVGLQTGVPWMMCKQNDAPDPVINTCNGLICGETFVGPNSPNKPALWTENWTSRSNGQNNSAFSYPIYGNDTKLRAPEDIAFAVALFIARKKGSFVSYYMYHGGTNFGRFAASYVTTSYYDGAPLDEYDFKCVAFLVNFDQHNTPKVEFRNISLELAPKSISVLSDCRNVVFETAKVNAQHGSRTANAVQSLNDINNWKAFIEPVPQDLSKSTYTGNQLFEQLTTTKDETDYLWYIVSYKNRASDGNQIAHLYVKSLAHILHAFVNNEYVGSVHGSHDGPRNIVLNTHMSLKEGDNTISLLSVMVGSPDSGAYMERRTFGIQTVGIQQGQQPMHLLNNDLWGYQVGLFGEKDSIYTQEGTNSVRWMDINNLIYHPLTWYKTTFSTPPGNDAVTLNLTSMGKGEVWVNGESIGRYWVSFKAPSGQPSQSLYHIPRGFLTPKDNLLVLVEEMGGDPLQITVNTMSVTTVCGNVDEFSVPPLQSRGKVPKVRIWCQGGNRISSIEFASYGNPVGDCRSFRIGSCHAESSESVVKQSCIGRRGCSIPVMAAKFGGDPCPGIQKSLLVVADCR
ncbi:Os05g0428100 [Oryza sativa Japonica Group]|uniref:Beta-galactosidase 7 n=2 Tax=Oryza sativa subsp. japonica TaxID=39947 RepID=BGAL7_ORYSJ|nr:RecName: Full=Beta-galactosidase 7; Short=Lactase 7; Flags: Precursor [Oryza sativa Japonica Group]AAS90664.1 putative beta-galactosidase [Oryza sativa Japonica Group]AAV25023.1 putative beta-galactosidase [Oryza sativa Japonica Group]BAH93163.1 Os05g0428100 [Oryza sativa Japonica Group]|eukprot:NP_001174435.1 Os05g0428100 [Oryza sativa Japonica Group]